MPPTHPARGPGLRAPLALALIGLGLALAGLGLFPGALRLDWTPGLGRLQITLVLLGLSALALGSYLYASTRRPAAGPHRLGEAIGVRLMATGLVLCYAAGYADLLGIGTEQPGDAMRLGPAQAGGVVLGAAVITAGLLVYSRPWARAGARGGAAHDQGVNVP